VEILMGSDFKKEEFMKKQNPKIKDNVKEEIEKIYNSICNLQCINNLSVIISKISTNEIKYTGMNDWVTKIEDINQFNKEVLD
jgi:hypothetical protein